MPARLSWRRCCAAGRNARHGAWLATLGEELVLNVAGPRQSEQPDAYAVTRRLLEEILRTDA